VFLVILETRALEVLHPIGLPAGTGGLVELIGERIALPLQPPVFQPIGVQQPANAFPGLREAALHRRRGGHLARDRLGDHRWGGPEAEQAGQQEHEQHDRATHNTLPGIIQGHGPHGLSPRFIHQAMRTL